MGCFTDESLLELAQGMRGLDAAEEVHLADCADCRMLLAAAARGAEHTWREDETAADPRAEPSFAELEQGARIAGRYVLDRFLGAGAMGVVWSAYREDDRTRVAIKIGRYVDEELCRRFEREARIASALEHPNVARSFEVISATPTRGPCLVQELLAGEPLESRLARDGCLSLGETARIVLPVGSALAAAHARGIVHRDLKPQNVFLSGARVVVIDFGIAKLLPAWGPHSKLTRTGGVVGTPRYMAPEQISGAPDVDVRADVWALGALIFRALAGRTPVPGNTVGEMIKGLRHGKVDDLAGLLPHLPPLILGVVRAALVVPREGRLSSVQPIIGAFAPFAAHP